METHRYTVLFRYVCKFLKYFLLGGLGLGFVCTIAVIVNLTSPVILVITWIGPWFLRLALIGLFLLGFVVFVESIQ